MIMLVSWYSMFYNGQKSMLSTDSNRDALKLFYSFFVFLSAVRIKYHGHGI